MKRVLWLAGALALAAFLRFDGLGEPSYWLDEVLHQRVTATALSQSWWRWLVGFEPENGPLYYASQALMRAFGSSEFAGRFPAALFGLIAVALLWLAGKHTKDHGIGAALLAISPLAIYYSREARPYALMMMLTAALMVALLRGWPVVAIALAMVYTAAAVAPVLVAALVVVVANQWSGGRLGRRALATNRRPRAAAAPLVLAIGALPLLYRGAAQPAGNSAPLHLDLAFFDSLLRNFSVTALSSHFGGRAAIALFALAIIGAVALAKRDRRTAIIVIGMAILPLVIALVALVVFKRWYAIRYVTPVLPAYLLLAGAGIAFVARRLHVIALVIVALFMTQTWHAARTEPWQKLNWRLIAEKIRVNARPGDLVLTAEPWSTIMIDWYKIPNVQHAAMETAPLAQLFANAHPSWLVTAGLSDDTSVRNWMCRYPLVLASPLENFRMHYAAPMRITSPPFLEENATWRFSKTRFKPDELRESKVVPLLEQLGFDPKYAWPRLRNGKLHLEDFGESVAYGSDCMDDAAFVRYACHVLLAREPGELDLVRTTRIEFVRRVMRGDEFRARVTGR
ncbi:MAG: hypothetical protein DMF56_07605 [Acidobacteria bacterium]|nr:MAG: hypothetical protein DMF56_07605 [Acidobacteriota bacterium]